MKKIVVIGGGTMGLDIAQVFAKKGYDVVVRDINDQIIQASEARLNKSLDKLVAKGKLDEAKKAEILSHMSFTTELAAAADADLVVEAAIENLDIKKSIFGELDKICKPETILASNTSSISITAIAAATQRADRFIGMHFFNPATVMKLVEVIRGQKTADATVAAVYEVAQGMGKTAVECKTDTPGFIVNRCLFAFMLEAIHCYEEGVASVDDIDTAIKLGLNHPMGPFEMMDMSGLDTFPHVTETLESLPVTTWKCPESVKKLGAEGKVGRKSG